LIRVFLFSAGIIVSPGLFLARLGDLSVDPAALEQAALEGKALLQGEKRCGRSGPLGTRAC